MTARCVHDKEPLKAFFRRDVYLHLYALGDLDEYCWPHTTWYALDRGRGFEAVALLYSGLTLPALLALDRRPEAMKELLARILHLLPRRFYAHLSPGLEKVFQSRH